MWNKTHPLTNERITCWENRFSILLERDPRIEGECARCGECCILADKFKYAADYQAMTLKPNHDLSGNYTPCDSYINGLCIEHDHKRPICSGWPFLPEDLLVVDCQGFKLKE